MVFDWTTKQHDSRRKSDILDRGLTVGHESSSCAVTIQMPTGISVVKEDSFCCLDCGLSTTITLSIMGQGKTLPDAPVLQELGVLHPLKWWPTIRSLLFWGSICSVPCTQMVTNLSGIWFSLPPNQCIYQRRLNIYVQRCRKSQLLSAGRGILAQVDLPGALWVVKGRFCCRPNIVPLSVKAGPLIQARIIFGGHWLACHSLPGVLNANIPALLNIAGEV